jgi:gluconokinase
MSSQPVLVGIDIGTSAVKVLACTPSGHVVASASAAYGLSTPRPGYVEQDANEVYRATMQVLRDALADVRLRGDEVAAVGFSSAMHAVLAVDDRGEPIAPLITWMDRRSAAVAERWHADGTADTLYARTGAPVHPMLPSCKLRWLAEHDADLVNRAQRFIGMKELVVFRWTGEWLVDWGIASATGLFDAAHHAWDPFALEEAGIDPVKLSEPAPTSHVGRSVRSSIADTLGLRGAAIVLASSDGALANLGVGAVAPGELALTLGTSGAIRAVVDTPSLDPRGRTFCYAFDDSRYIAGGPTSSAGAVLNKIFELVMPEVEATARFGQAIALAQSAPEGANGLTLVPFLSGERAPYWLSELRGAFIGLDLAHTRADIARAAFESVVFALASVQDVLRERVGQPRRIRLSGGLTQAPLIRRLVADVFGSEAVLADQEEASAFGAAMMAGIAIGVVADAASVTGMLHPKYVQRADKARVARYKELFARYRECVDAVIPLFEASPPKSRV